MWTLSHVSYPQYINTVKMLSMIYFRFFPFYYDIKNIHRDYCGYFFCIFNTELN